MTIDLYLKHRNSLFKLNKGKCPKHIPKHLIFLITSICYSICIGSITLNKHYKSKLIKHRKLVNQLGCLESCLKQKRYLLTKNFSTTKNLLDLLCNLLDFKIKKKQIT